ncbi:MAG: hypothetical protein ACRYGR_10760 [Janthinobacterium lividum]
MLLAAQKLLAADVVITLTPLEILVHAPYRIFVNQVIAVVVAAVFLVIRGLEFCTMPLDRLVDDLISRSQILPHSILEILLMLLCLFILVAMDLTVEKILLAKDCEM